MMCRVSLIDSIRGCSLMLERNAQLYTLNTLHVHISACVTLLHPDTLPSHSSHSI